MNSPVLATGSVGVTPARPIAAMKDPTSTVCFEVTVEVAHLANPLLAVSRLLASEARAFARVAGDEHRFTVEVVLPDGGGSVDREYARSWVHWALHNAGVRGQVSEIDRTADL